VKIELKNGPGPVARVKAISISVCRYKTRKLLV